MRTRLLALLALAIYAAVAAVTLGGCAAVGPTATQNAAGQRTANSPLDTTNMTVTPEGVSTFSATARGPVTEALVDDAGIESRTTGIVPRRIIWTRDGQRLSIDSGSDIQAEGVEIDPATGSIKVARFSTSASEPLRALNEAIADFAPVWMKFSEDEKQRFLAAMEAVKATAPGLFEILAAALKAAGVPVP